jgi:hypothetical protein
VGRVERGVCGGPRAVITVITAIIFVEATILMIIRGLRCILVVVNLVPRRTTINIPVEVKTELERIREQLGAGDWAEFFEKIIKIYEEWRSSKLEKEVKEVLCNDLSEARATLQAWGRLLASKLGDPDKIAVALKYLKLDQSGEYVVDRELCSGQ